MAIADLPPSIEHRVAEVRFTCDLEGEAGQALVHQFARAVEQWNDLPSQSIVQDVHDEIRHVPFAKAGTMKVRFSKPTRMKPRQLDMSDQVEDD
jgi:hypothetical protein